MVIRSLIMATTGLATTVKIQKLDSADSKWIKKMWHIHHTIVFSFKKIRNLSLMTTWVKLGSITSERSHSHERSLIGKP